MSVLARTGHPADPVAVLSGERSFHLTRASGEVVPLALSISNRRAILADYDPRSTSDPVIVDEIDRIASADGLIFVVDSRAEREAANVHQFSKLVRDTATRAVDIRSKPIVFQVNKRDASDAMSMDRVRELLNPGQAVYVESVAVESYGTLEALRTVLKLAGAIA